jgi:hypothetical protein
VPDIDSAYCTYANAEALFKAGLISQERWERYCYEWRTGAPRFSNLGLIPANNHAKRHGLPLLPNMDD